MGQAEYRPLKKMYGISGHIRDLAGGGVGGKHDGRKVMISGRGNDNREIRFYYNVCHAVLSEGNEERRPEKASEWSYEDGKRES
jgi:hypothetical protein